MVRFIRLVALVFAFGVPTSAELESHHQQFDLPSLILSESELREFLTELHQLSEQTIPAGEQAITTRIAVGSEDPLTIFSGIEPIIQGAAFPNEITVLSFQYGSSGRDGYSGLSVVAGKNYSALLLSGPEPNDFEVVSGQVETLVKDHSHWPGMEKFGDSLQMFISVYFGVLIASLVVGPFKKATLQSICSRIFLSTVLAIVFLYLIPFSIWFPDLLLIDETGLIFQWVIISFVIVLIALGFLIQSRFLKTSDVKETS